MITSNDVAVILGDLYKGSQSFWTRNETAVFTILGMLAVIVVQLVVEWRKERRFKKAVTASFCAEVGTILDLIDTREYQKGLSGIISTINVELETIKQPGAIIDRRRDLFEPYLEMNNANVFSLIYSHNSQHVGLMEDSMARDIVRFYVLTHSLLEDAMAIGRRIIKDTECFTKSMSEEDLYKTRLEQLGICYGKDALFLDELISLGKSIVKRCPKTASLW